MSRRFLNRNQYCIWFSSRCNYACEYCCNHSVQNGPKSYVEEHPEEVIALFQDVEPGVITVSGGEPTLWEDMPILLEALPMQKWVILTNLSREPAWFYHPNVVLLIAAYHPTQTGADRFAARFEKLKQKTVAKILVTPGKEREHLKTWCEWNLSGLVTHLAPVNWPVGCADWFLNELREGFWLSSCLYNSRFLIKEHREWRGCIAGTKDMFQIGPRGKILRCSQAGPVLNAHISDPWFYPAEQICSMDCWCEWHHWAGVTRANDNETWTHFVETGEWWYPEPTDLLVFLEAMKWRDPIAAINAL